MSDALTYLVKARPQEMAAYFTFLKGAGKHLDPKTRNLISVITKVHAQTENGLRQYLKRALREGATADEVVDALLMAFPALGLARIVWAVDVILKMNLPEFALDRLAGDSPDAEPAGVWHDVIAEAALVDGSAVRASCDGRGLFVFRRGPTVKVYDSRCPHQSTDIPHLALQGTRLTCPKHEWAFDIETGRCVAKGDVPLTQLAHRIEGGRVQVRW
ncbi:MAG: Rieske 2Fe-2S domain-containing protein [Betaproteobacteria bacterium]|jgi:nitrite reductase/ring-hydroxylating ferredoxin subunit/alkylhydroperoxidase/carboxymuconolactone decarboxylase family protein YurZ|nr:Rieske 2Fe-2S domain-containing protein [Betaproteobacteria bacterium]MBK7743745.1 Rieske 2Fe-2S domain-containing protein [Betaproteobacteria bacterium]